MRAINKRRTSEDVNKRGFHLNDFVLSTLWPLNLGTTTLGAASGSPNILLTSSVLQGGALVSG